MARWALEEIERKVFPSPFLTAEAAESTRGNEFYLPPTMRMAQG